MKEKSTVYLDERLKEEVQVILIKQGEKQSLSALVNELLEEWLKKNRYK